MTKLSKEVYDKWKKVLEQDLVPIDPKRKKLQRQRKREAESNKENP